MDFDLERNLRFKDSVGKFIKVKTVNTCEYEGWLKCIDPMTGNLFLVTLDDNFSVNETILIPGHAYSRLEVIKKADENVQNIVHQLYGVDTLHHEDAGIRKQRLVAWLKLNRLPVIEKEDETLEVCETVIISPPYDIQNCSSLNGRVLKNIIHLILKLPQNVDVDSISEENKATESVS